MAQNGALLAIKIKTLKPLYVGVEGVKYCVMGGAIAHLDMRRHNATLRIITQ
jgi:hypothetical protein